MRNASHIILKVILAGSVCMLMACNSSMEQKEKLSAVADSAGVTQEQGKTLEELFESDTLSAIQLGLFQQRAQQKLQDLINYVELISNKGYDSELRKEAKNQGIELFADTINSINIPVTATQKIPCSFSAFLKEVEQSTYDSILVKTDSVMLLPAESTTEAMKYKGAVNAKVTINGYKNGKITFTSTGVHQAATIISKSEKQFGIDKKTRVDGDAGGDQIEVKRRKFDFGSWK